VPADRSSPEGRPAESIQICLAQESLRGRVCPYLVGRNNEREVDVAQRGPGAGTSRFLKTTGE